MSKLVRIQVSGLVQGVYFRSSARRVARRLGLGGFARNEGDGSVTIEVEGEPEAVERFVAWCWVGPKKARVERVEVEEGEGRGYAGFEVRR